MRAYIAVVGSGEPDAKTDSVAEQLGAEIARRGGVLVCGGLEGVMESACRGARGAGGMTVGILPGLDRSHGNPHLDIALPTGIGEMRNALIVRAADAVIAVGGEFGTLSEVAFALKTGKPVVGLATWELARPDGRPVRELVAASSPADAVATALELAGL